MKQIDFLIGNQYVSNNSTIANSFNIYFTNIGGSLAKTIKSDIDPLVFLHTNVNSINIHEITFHEVEHIISNMTNSAAGYDELPSSIMKQYVIIKIIIIICNICIAPYNNILYSARVIQYSKHTKQTLLHI